MAFDDSFEREYQERSVQGWRDAYAEWRKAQELVAPYEMHGDDAYDYAQAATGDELDWAVLD